MANLCLVMFVLTGIFLGSSTSGVIDCDTDADCIDEATCLDGICECDKGYIFSLDGTRCLRYSFGYRGECEDDAQCSWLMGKHYCNSGYCECESDYQYLMGQCVLTRGLGEACTRDVECHVTNDLFAMKCQDGVCGCSDGYYARGDYDCRPQATNLDDGCALNSDCQMEDAECYIYQCTAIGSTRSISIENNTIAKANSIAIGTYALGTNCATNEDCEDVQNSMCSSLTNECICKRGYYFDESNGCVGEIGTDVGCTVDSDCLITPPRRCLDGACVCPVTHYHSEDLRRCIRVAYTPVFTCTDNIACQIFSKDAICVADSDNIYSFCSCPVNYFVNDDFVCEEEEEVDNCAAQRCVVDSDCDIVLNSVCSNNVCGCPNDFRLLDDATCLPNINGECDAETKICEIENAECNDNVCSCFTGYTALNETTCVESLSGLHADCEFNIQCSDIVANSECIEEECQCSDGYTENGIHCNKTRLFGDYCDNVLQCGIALGGSVQCRNSYCQCAADATINADGLDCTPSAGAVDLIFSPLLVFNSLIAVYVRW